MDLGLFVKSHKLTTDCIAILIQPRATDGVSSRAGHGPSVQARKVGGHLPDCRKITSKPQEAPDANRSPDKSPDSYPF